MKPSVKPTPVPTELPHTFACQSCSDRRTLRQKLWQIVLWCDRCRDKTIHKRID